MQEGDADATKHYELLKISILARIDDYDQFYKRHFVDPRISFFEKQKYRLRKLIYESDYGKNKIVKPQPRAANPRTRSVDKTSALNRSREVSPNEVVIEIKMNKQDFNKMQNQKAKAKVK